MIKRELKDSIRIHGESFYPFWERVIIINPSKYSWISINWIIVNRETLVPQKGFWWSRYLSVVDPKTGWTYAEVVEHFLSACYSTWISNITVESPRVMPVVWPWIHGLYNELLKHSEIVEKDSGPLVIQRKITFYSNDWSCTFSVEPSETLDISIERIWDGEIWIDTHISVKDVYRFISENENARKARPIARLQNRIINSTQYVMESLGWYGVSSKNYILHRPWATTKSIQEQMYPEFQNLWNEHLAHTLVADLFGELHTFFPHWIVWKISLKWKNNHFTRMELLHALYNQIKPL